MVTITPFKVDSKSFHESVVMPMFGDILGAEGETLIPSDENGDWVIMDNPRHRAPIIGIHGNANILKRRDATCKLIYTSIGRLGNRWVYDEELYGAVEDCQQEFYQGCFEDYTNENWEVFGEHIMPMIYKASATDVYTMKYFGDVERPGDPNNIHNWNKFDGIWTHYNRYVTAGIVETPIDITEGDMDGSDAYGLLLEMYNMQDEILDAQDDANKVFYVNKKIYDAYGEFLMTGSHNAVLSLTELQSGTARLFFKGIEIKPKKWNGILKALNGGTQAHAAILTLRGNFIFKTDSTHGGGRFRNEAVRVWYSDEYNVWKREVYLRGGTEIIAPQHSVLAITDMSGE